MRFTHWPSFAKGFVCVESRAAVREESEARPCPPEAPTLVGAIETGERVQLAFERHSAVAYDADTWCRDHGASGVHRDVSGVVIRESGPRLQACAQSSASYQSSCFHALSLFVQQETQWMPP